MRILITIIVCFTIYAAHYIGYHAGKIEGRAQGYEQGKEEAVCWLESAKAQEFIAGLDKLFAAQFALYQGITFNGKYYDVMAVTPIGEGK